MLYPYQMKMQPPPPLPPSLPPLLLPPSLPPSPSLSPSSTLVEDVPASHYTGTEVQRRGVAKAFSDQHFYSNCLLHDLTCSLPCFCACFPLNSTKADAFSIPSKEMKGSNLAAQGCMLHRESCDCCDIVVTVETPGLRQC